MLCVQVQTSSKQGRDKVGWTFSFFPLFARCNSRISCSKSSSATRSFFLRRVFAARCSRRFQISFLFQLTMCRHGNFLTVTTFLLVFVDRSTIFSSVCWSMCNPLYFRRAEKSLDRHSRPFPEARRVWDFSTQLAPSTCQLSALLSVDVARASPVAVAKEVQENTLSSPKEEFVSDASRDSVS